jgi:arsenate reductase-like glutaredoxin family protein
MYINYRYSPLSKIWLYNGHRCSRCDNIFKSIKAINIHTEACRYRHGKIDRRALKNKEEIVEPNIITIHGTEWQPIMKIIHDKSGDTFQNLTNDK